MKIKLIKISIVLAVTFTSSVMSAEKTKLRISTHEMKPFHYMEDGKITGLYTDMIETVLKNIGVEYRINMYPMIREDQMLLNGEIDALYDAADHGVKKGKLIIPEEQLLHTIWGMWVQKKDEHKLKFDSLENLNGYRMGLVRGYMYAIWANFRPHIEKHCDLRDVRNDTINIVKLANDRLDYTVYEVLAGSIIAEEKGIADKIVFLNDAALNKYYPSNLMFSKRTMSGRRDLIRKFSMSLREFKKTDQFRKLCIKYFKKELPDVNVWGPPE